MTKKQLLSLGFAAATLTVTSQAAVIAGTNFDSRTLNGSNMEDLVWSTDDVNGAQVTANTTATTSATSFATNGLNPGQFAPNQNIKDGSSWTGTFQITVAAGFTADLSFITFDFDSLNSSGNLQGAAQIRNITFDMTINGSAYGSQQGGDIAGTANNVATFTENLQLSEGVHTIVITADGNSNGVFAPIDDFSINGAVTAAVPEPSSTALLGLGGLALILRRRK